MSADVLVIGIGNDFRRDNGVGLAVAGEIAKRRLSGVRAISTIGEPGSILEHGPACRSRVAVDAAMGEGSIPGKIRRWTPGDAAEPNVSRARMPGGWHRLTPWARRLGQMPQKLVVSPSTSSMSATVSCSHRQLPPPYPRRSRRYSLNSPGPMKLGWLPAAKLPSERGLVSAQPGRSGRWLRSLSAGARDPTVPARRPVCRRYRRSRVRRD